ncbi:DUF4142 domain-containing protein [Geobacter sp. SVR]|uniref:DUF4142 domain-containing protein n=1 Tax=Geobacter sp. SVR TaxID=2495594 RepID=UPI00143EFF06|nr:DUF4142 domain-containing protein [Geobacter sp. SVR]BCS52709.1 hypothetical protein GSVR_10170 [Geobacter sp. SVR]GCF86795.1 hypothetical protein GSbR_33950 [Geobacter sp. SVR]
MHTRNWILVIIGMLVFGSIASLGFAAGGDMAAADKKFIKEAASGGMLEVQLGEIAQTKAQSQQVKDFGSKMVTDHGKANDELKQLAQQKQIDLPSRLESKHKSMLDKLQKLSGADFDKQYMKMMVKDHVKDVKDFKDATQKVKDPDLKAWAGKTLPVLEQHLQLARDTAAKVGAETGKAGGKGM